MLLVRSIFSNQLRRFCSVVNNIREPLTLKQLNFSELKHKTKVPQTPYITPPAQQPSEKFEIDKESLELLVKFSLVNITDKQALMVLEESIAFASKILPIDTTDIEPLYHVHEEQFLDIRDDKEKEGNITDILLKNSSLIEEEYFVAPPGNVEIEYEELDL